MTGVFIQSYDCEGLWGISDHIGPADRARFTDETLAATYQRLITLLDRLSLPATFAFVGAFALGRDELVAALPRLRDIDARCPGYLTTPLRDLAEGRLPGWRGDHCLARVEAAETRHEIGLHGYSHLPWTAPGFDRDVAALELDGAREAWRGRDPRPKTFVYPRNAAAWSELLRQDGFLGLRWVRPDTGRIRRFLSEFDLRPTPDAAWPRGDAFHIPPGYFFNIRFGVRALVPATITKRRWRALIDSACATGGVAHLWCHPENFVNHEDDFGTLAAILEHVDRRRARGDMIALTQLDYALRGPGAEARGQATEIAR